MRERLGNPRIDEVQRRASHSPTLIDTGSRGAQ
jgi:hypothetical protein